MKLKSIAGWALGAVAAALVLCSFSSIWPLAAVDVGKPKQEYIVRARQALDAEGIDHAGYVPFVSLAVRSQSLDTLHEELGCPAAARLAGEPNGLVRYYVRFKKAGTPRKITVVLHPGGALIGYLVEDDPDLPKGGFTEGDFRAAARAALRRHFQVDLATLEEAGFDSQTKDGVALQRLEARRPFAGSPDLLEIFTAAAGGGQMTAVGRRVELTPSAALERKRARGAEEATDQFAFLLLGLALAGGYILFLFQLRSGKIELGPALKVSALLFAMAAGSALLDANARYQAWDPVWPRAAMWFKLASQELATASWALILGWAFLAGGSAAPGGGPEKTALFWRWCSLEWRNRAVARAGLRGAAIGFICGAATIALVKFFDSTCGGLVGLQPRAFCLSILDRQFPALAIVIFFLPVAVVEEAGYRLFAGLWVRRFTGSKALAIALPAILFGLTHTSLGFLPPEKPWWGRALIMIVIGLIWGWAFFRFDFLTVVISHFMADVVIFSWPLLVSEYRLTQVTAALGITVPLWPALLVGSQWMADRARSWLRDG